MAFQITTNDRPSFSITANTSRSSIFSITQNPTARFASIISVPWEAITGTSNLLDGIGRGDADLPAAPGFWSDIDPIDPNIFKIRNRLALGNAALVTSARISSTETYIAGDSIGATFAYRDAQLAVMQERGGIAVSGITKSSLGDGVSFLAPIGVGAFIINDTTVNSRNSWAFYADVQHQPTGTSVSTFAFEAAVKNKTSSNVSGDPYSLGGGAVGFWMQAGGDPSYGGDGVNPPNAAMIILSPASATTWRRWNSGIIIGDGALTDLGSGTGDAMRMPQKSQLKWYVSTGNTGAVIRSDVSIAGRGMQQIFDNYSLFFNGPSGVQLARFIHDSTATVGHVNTLGFNNSIEGGAPSVEARGSDTNVDLKLTTKGTGVVQFGTFTGSTVTHTGTVTIRDAGGTLRKVMVGA